MIPFSIGGCWNFSEGLAAVMKKDKWGYIDREGYFAIPPQFTDADGFSEGLAAVEKNNKYGYIGKSGAFAITPRFDAANDFREGVATVFVGEKHHIIDKQGNTLATLADNITNVEPFSDGLAPIEIDWKYGYINHEGKVVIPPRFDFAGPFVDGLAIVETNDKWGLIDKGGNYVVPAQYDDADYFSEGVMPVLIDGQWRFVDGQGNTLTILGDKYETVNCLVEGRASVLVNHKLGAIDRNGNLIIDIRFDQLHYFSEGLAYARIGNTHGFVNPSGEFELQRPMHQRTLLDRLLGRNKNLQW